MREVRLRFLMVGSSIFIYYLVWNVLQIFYLKSSLKINKQKSKFVTSTDVPQSKLWKFESLLHFSHTAQMDKCIGFPMLTRRVKNSDFHIILDKINGRLTSWKMSLLIVMIIQYKIFGFRLAFVRILMLLFFLSFGAEILVIGLIERLYLYPKFMEGYAFVLPDSLIQPCLANIFETFGTNLKSYRFMLKAKYFKQGDSCIWHAIVKAVEVLGPSFIWQVDKDQVSIWYDKWYDIMDTNLCFGGMVENEVWNFNILYTQLPTLHKELIHNIINY